MTAKAGYTVGMQVRLGRNLEACARAATSPLSVDEFLARFPQVEFVDVQGAGHMVAGDRNDLFAEAVVDFLNRHAG